MCGKPIADHFQLISFHFYCFPRLWKFLLQATSKCWDSSGLRKQDSLSWSQSLTRSLKVKKKWNDEHNIACEEKSWKPYSNWHFLHLLNYSKALSCLITSNSEVKFVNLIYSHHHLQFKLAINNLNELWLFIIICLPKVNHY